MTINTRKPSQLWNPLATAEQLATSRSQQDGVPADLEASIRFAGARLTQAAGILLQLPQEIIAQAVVLFTRFWIGVDGGSLCEHGAWDVAAASLYMAAKPSLARSPRKIVNVCTYVAQPISTFQDLSRLHDKKSAAEDYYVSEGTYESARKRMLDVEARILRVLGFQTHVALPYALCINYLQALDVFGNPSAGSQLTKRAFAHLNTALLSPQLLYVTHQPCTLATAAIYLAAREVAVKLPSEEWWEVFDTDREELGFLVVGLMSMEGFATEEKAKWDGREVPWTVEAVGKEMDRRILAGSGE
ncbi:cyclin-like protein [Cryomyces antarcticus]|nr:hypothetical protein LTR60_002504 [Cryomyces antarcticus]KAK5149277.1 hypothetical protein LTR04_007245 [Oleoguttula sp. CCFEE 6159]